MKTADAQTNKEGGSVLVITAVSMFALLLSAGLAINLNKSHSTKTELQAAADASAVAAASQLNSTANGIKSAVSQATKTLENYDFKSKVTIASSEVRFAAQLNGDYVDMTKALENPSAVRFARVTFSPPVENNLIVLLIPHANDISATASADVPLGLMMDDIDR